MIVLPVNKRYLFLLIILFSSVQISFSQDFTISEPQLKFDGIRLSINYDLSANRHQDIFYVWVEIKNKTGSIIDASCLKGDHGEKIKAGNNKTIIWIPAEDSIILDEEISVELFGEKYEKPFNKSSALLTSSIVPGLGLTKIKDGKKWWFISLPAYGALAGGLIYHFNYLSTYDDYRIEESLPVREDLLLKARRQSDISSICFISAAAIWAADMIWVAVSPNRYKPLKHAGLSFSTYPYDSGRINMVSLRIVF